MCSSNWAARLGQNAPTYHLGIFKDNFGEWNSRVNDQISRFVPLGPDNKLYGV